jgi:aspartokinase/homoserine dehydrogenase 1
LNVIHESFFEERKRVAIAVLGVGNVGGAVLDRLRQQRKALLQKGFDVRVCAIANSRRYLFDRSGLDLSNWRQKLADSHHESRMSEIVSRLHAETFTHLVLVDCTASGKVVSHYPDFIRANAHIVTPNKKANVLPWKQYEALLQLLESRDKHFLFEANVGAGLPVISTLQDLIHSGDRVEKIEGIFSGTLSYLFNGYDGTKPFSEVVRTAYRLGLTEPDPRDDLSGMDVARKLLILARTLGFRMNLSDIRVQSLVSDRLKKSLSPQEFLARCEVLDAPIHRRFEQARKTGAALKYVGRFERGTASAGLVELPLSHPLATTKGTDNVIAFSTDRYKSTPLVIQGPGAGAEVTASGVFSDLLKLFYYLPL